VGTKKQNWRDRCTPRKGLVMADHLHAEYGELRQPLKSMPMAKMAFNGHLMGPSRAFPRFGFHGRTRQSPASYWNLDAFVSDRQSWLPGTRTAGRKIP
jgi:hypothetical protein